LFDAGYYIIAFKGRRLRSASAGKVLLACGVGDLRGCELSGGYGLEMRRFWRGDEVGNVDYEWICREDVCCIEVGRTCCDVLGGRGDCDG
jgi:hypothetical protein